MTATFVNPLPGVPDVESPFFEQLLAAKKLDAETERIVRDVREHGYARFTFPIPDFRDFAMALRKDLEGKYVGRIQDAWRFCERVRAVAANERVLQILEAIYGRRPIPFQTLNFDRGTQQTFHSDIVHFSSMPERFMCGVWVALEDIGPTQGPLQYVPGSHKWPVYVNEHVGAMATEMEYLENYPLFEKLWQQLIDVHHGKADQLTGPCGMALVWAANLLHGGAKMLDPQSSRHSQVNHYYFENCTYYTPLNSDPAYGTVFYRDIVDIRSGKPVPNMCCGQQVPRHRFDQALDFGVRRYGGLGLHKFV